MANISVLNIPRAIPECNSFLTSNRSPKRLIIIELVILNYFLPLALIWSSDYITNIRDSSFVGLRRMDKSHKKSFILRSTTENGQTMNEQTKIELFDNPRPQRDYCITIRCPEFTSVCPRTGQPDFGEIVIEYCPDKSCIELKSLKFYMQSYRNKGIFYEALTNDILDDLSGACRPHWMKVTSRFSPRGGITTEVVAEYKADK